MGELIQRLVAEYRADQITWHDIQDQVEAYVLMQDGKGLNVTTTDIAKRFAKSNAILTKIENLLKEGV